MYSLLGQLYKIIPIHIRYPGSEWRLFTNILFVLTPLFLFSSASLDDSSCGFLGVAYDHVVAYILGIGEEAWTQIRALVCKNGPLEITMVGAVFFVLLMYSLK